LDSLSFAGSEALWPEFTPAFRQLDEIAQGNGAASAFDEMMMLRAQKRQAVEAAGLAARGPLPPLEPEGFGGGGGGYWRTPTTYEVEALRTRIEAKRNMFHFKMQHVFTISAELAVTDNGSDIILVALNQPDRSNPWLKLATWVTGAAGIYRNSEGNLKRIATESDAIEFLRDTKFLLPDEQPLLESAYTVVDKYFDLPKKYNRRGPHAEGRLIGFSVLGNLEPLVFMASRTVCNVCLDFHNLMANEYGWNSVIDYVPEQQ
jgi:hypothetical protein